MMRAIHKAISVRLNAFLFIFTSWLFTPGMMLPTMAQVTSDGTTNTIVKQSGNNFNILNGIERGNNLFHSFSNFSVPTNGSARFDLINTPNITTIFSRVTGGNVSNIDGLIRTLNSNNAVSLFLMNPAGILFGKNASLNISGSFVGTTANSIKFADYIITLKKNQPKLYSRVEDLFTALPAAMRYILKSESFDRRGQEEKLYCIIAGSAVKKLH